MAQDIPRRSCFEIWKGLPPGDVSCWPSGYRQLYNINIVTSTYIYVNRITARLQYCYYEIQVATIVLCFCCTKSPRNLSRSTSWSTGRYQLDTLRYYIILYAHVAGILRRVLARFSHYYFESTFLRKIIYTHT